VLFGYEILPAQIQAENPLLVPTFSYLIYPALQRRWSFGPLRKIGFGMLLVGLTVSGWAQVLIHSGETPSIIWQLFAYLLLTSSEVMVSITCLEYSYTQEPNSMKSFVMAFFMMSIALGNLFTSAVNFAIEGRDTLQGADYYLFFSPLLFATTLLFAWVSRYFPQQVRLQKEL
jgi:POT family proton-dependent oligopeptide transporter